MMKKLKINFDPTYFTGTPDRFTVVGTINDNEILYKKTKNNKVVLVVLADEPIEIDGIKYHDKDVYGVEADKSVKNSKIDTKIANAFESTCKYLDETETLKRHKYKNVFRISEVANDKIIIECGFKDADNNITTAGNKKLLKKFVAVFGAENVLDNEALTGKIKEYNNSLNPE
jgi:hypothetical protein